MAYPWAAGDVVTASDLNDAIANAGGGGGGASVTVSDTAPSSPSEGDLWFESDTGDILVYYGSAWVDVGGTSVANIAVQSTAPTEPPVNGDLWFDTDTAQTFVWYDDGTSTQWVEVGAASAAASGTDGAVQFASGGALSSDASNLVWDDTNNRLGIGTTSPGHPLDVVGDMRVQGSNPKIWLTDNDVGADAKIDGSGTVGGLLISADNFNELAGSIIAFNVDGSERVRIDSSGNVTTPNQTSWRVGLSSNTTFTGGATTKIGWNQTSGNDCYVTNCTLSSGTITVPASGVYALAVHIRTESANGGGPTNVLLRKNGVNVTRIYQTAATVSSYQHYGPLVQSVKASAGDFFEVFYIPATTAILSSASNTVCHFSGHLLG